MVIRGQTENALKGKIALAAQEPSATKVDEDKFSSP